MKANPRRESQHSEISKLVLIEANVTTSAGCWKTSHIRLLRQLQFSEQATVGSWGCVIAVLRAKVF